MTGCTKAIFLKELRRFFLDRRIVLGTIVLPGIMLFAVYYLINMIGTEEASGSVSYGSGEAQAIGASGDILAMIIPIAIIIFLFIGCISAATESIAGEKERGNTWTILVTPVKRSSLALGKVCALSIIAVLSALSSSLGMLLAFVSMGDSYGGFACITGYGIKGYAAMLMTIMITAVLIVGFIAVLSMFGKTVREAQVYTMPLIVIATAVCVMAVMESGGEGAEYLYAIPLYNSVRCLADTMKGAGDISSTLITFASNFVYAGVFVLLLSRLYRSEKCV